MSPSITPKKMFRGPENLSNEFGEFGFYAPRDSGYLHVEISSRSGASALPHSNLNSDPQIVCPDEFCVYGTKRVYM